MTLLEKLVRGIDGWQQRHVLPEFVFGVVKKFGDDNAGVLASNLAFSAFAALFPLLLLLVTILGILLAHDPSYRQRVLNSALAQFPVIGNQLGNNIHALRRSSSLALAVSLVGLLWSATGLSQAGLFAMSEIWNLPGPERPDFAHRVLRSFAFLAVLAGGLILTSALAGVGVSGAQGLQLSIVFGLLVLLISVGQYLLGFRVLTSGVVATRKLIPGAVVGGIAWTILQFVGGWLVGHELRGPSEVYGTFAVVIGLVAWMFLGVRVSIYAAELNTVVDRHLWPRSVIQPPLTPADKESLALQATQNQRRPEQTVSVSFSEGGDSVGAGSGMSIRDDTGGSNGH